MKIRKNNSNKIKIVRVIVVLTIALTIIAFLLLSKTHFNKAYAIDVSNEPIDFKTYTVNNNIQEINVEEIIAQNTKNTYKEE